MASHTNRFSTKDVLLTGALIGGSLALFGASRTGGQFGSQLKSYIGNAIDEIMKNWGPALERGIAYAERGHQALQDAEQLMGSAINHGKQYLDSGKGVVHPVGERGAARGAADEKQYFLAAGALLAGALVGGCIALIATPQSGTQFRGQLKSYAGKARDKMTRTWGMATDQGPKYAARH